MIRVVSLKAVPDGAITNYGIQDTAMNQLFNVNPNDTLMHMYVAQSFFTRMAFADAQIMDGITR